MYLSYNLQKSLFNIAWSLKEYVNSKNNLLKLIQIFASFKTHLDI